jgi:hypothetical protein
LIKTFASVNGFLIPVQQDQGYPANAGSQVFLGRSAQLAVSGQPRQGLGIGESRSSGGDGRRLRAGNAMTNVDGPSGMPDQDETDSGTPPMGTLVIRTWYEPHQMPSFRARITYSQVPGNDPVTVVAADPDAALSVVRQWLFAQPGSLNESLETPGSEA